MQGSTASMNSRKPTRQEMDECRKFYLSDPDHWDPENVTYRTMAQIDSVQTQSPRVTVLPPITNLGDYNSRKSVIASMQRSPVINQMQKKATDAPLSAFGGKNVLTKDQHQQITPELISRKWGCGLLTARNTLSCTTQLGVRSAIGPLTRRYRTDISQLHYCRLNTTFYTDTMFAKSKSLKNNTSCQIYTE